MSDVTAAAAGAGLLILVWLSVVRTVFVPQRGSSRAARWTVQVLFAVSVSVAHRLPLPLRRLLLDVYAPASLFVVVIAWVLGVEVGFVLLARAAGLVVNLDDLTRFLTLRLDGAAVVWQLGALGSVALVAGAFLAHLVRFLIAYDRRERMLSGLLVDPSLLADPDHLLTDLRLAQRHRVDDYFADWDRWLAETCHAHLSCPALAHSRSAGSLSWLQAAVIVLDSAALLEAVAPTVAPSGGRALLRNGSAWLQQMAEQMGVVIHTAPVSLQGREERAFDETVGVAISVGLTEERDRHQTWTRFQQLRGRYAPYAAAIDFQLGRWT
ncbi:hypothetical protein ACGFIW_31945 [Micromonospora sp. NPDC048935]|uniref:hypothetical protein n=1 Tax=Micromonospora sp. NPDC048935 TaxID=3364262 RepID=UPI0037203A5F